MRAEPVARARFDDRTLAALTLVGEEQTLAARARIVLDRPFLTIVLEGYVRVFRDAAFVRDVSVYLAARGAPLGVERLLNEPRIETGAQALGPARLLFVPIAEFERLAASDSRLYVQIAEALAARTLRVLEALEAYGRTAVESRVAGTLVHLADDYGVEERNGVRLDLPLSQEDLATLIGVTRESCSSALADFARRGIVRGRRLRGLLVVDHTALRSLAGLPDRP